MQTFPQRIVLSVVLSAGLISPCLAQIPISQRPEAERRPSPTFANNQWTVDVTGRGLDYRETSPARGILDTETGGHVGIDASAGFQRDMVLRNMYFFSQFRMTQGTLTHGDIQPAFDGIAGTKGNIKDFNFRLGKAFRLGNRAQIVPYLGMGRRNWVRDFSAVQGGYYEQYDHNYAGA